MTVVRTLGKNTLGDNNKMKVAMRDYDMSTHDISTIFRSSIGVGIEYLTPHHSTALYAVGTHGLVGLKPNPPKPPSS